MFFQNVVFGYKMMHWRSESLFLKQGKEISSHTCMKSTCETNSFALVITVAKRLLGSKSKTANPFRDETINSCINLNGWGRSEKFRTGLLEGDEFLQCWGIHAAVTSNPINTALHFLQSHPKHCLLWGMILVYIYLGYDMKQQFLFSQVLPL